MTDILVTDAPLHGIAPVFFGYAHLTDNHKNSLIGRDLSCNGGRPQRVGVWDFAWLMNEIGSVASATFPSLDSRITYDGMKSPLEAECRALTATAPSHASKGKGTGHSI